MSHITADEAPWYDEIPPNWQAPADLAVVLRAEADEDPTLHAVMWNTPRDQQLLRHAAAEVERLSADNERLHALAMTLGLHLTALCDHPENWENRYDLPAGRPCPGCYDARDAFLASLADEGGE